MNNLQKFKHLVLAALLLAPCGAAWADWELDTTKSSINFISIKNDSVAETHSFSNLAGSIGNAGDVQVRINLDSVQTSIALRDERMRKLLFETTKFPVAQVTAQVDPTVLAEAARGGTVTTDISVSLSLHGQNKPLAIPVVVIGGADGSLRVLTVHPVVINAVDFGLDSGVSALRDIAKLGAISSAVPVSLQLLFVQSKVPPNQNQS